MRGETGGAKNLVANVGRRLAENSGSSVGDISADREDSPLQSKRSSMCKKIMIQNYFVHFTKRGKDLLFLTDRSINLCLPSCERK